MIITPEQKTEIENIIKECHGFKNNEHLLEKFTDEVVKRAGSFLKGKKSIDSIKVYLKRIANIVILELTSKSEVYKFSDYSGFDAISTKPVSLSQIQVNLIKNSMHYMEDEAELYEKMFKLRYFHGLKNNEIADKLGKDESEIASKLLLLISNLRQEL